MGFLKIAGADFGRGDMGRNGNHRHAGAVAVEQPVDEVQIAGPATAGANGEFAGEMRLGASGKCRHLLVTNMQPFDCFGAPQGVGEPIKAVADQAIDTFDPGRRERRHHLICNGLFLRPQNAHPEPL